MPNVDSTEGLTPPGRILIVRMSHLGDVVQTMPLVHALRERWPGAELGWAIQPEFAPLVAPFARTILFERQGGARAWPKIRRALRAFKPDLALDAQGNWKSAFCTRLSGAPWRVGFPRSAWQEPGAAWLAGATCLPEPEPTAPEHLVARCRELARAVTGRAAPLDLDPLLSEVERVRGEDLLESALGAGGERSRSERAKPPTILHPGVEGDPRTWPKERFRDLGAALIERGHQVLCLTGPGEAPSGEWLRNGLPQGAHLVGQRGLRDLCALLAATAQRGGQMFACDSGPAHVAASVGLPVRLLAGPEDPGRTGPWPADALGPHVSVGAPWDRPRPIESVTVAAALAAALPPPSSPVG